MYWDDPQLDDSEDRKNLDMLLDEGLEPEQRILPLERLLDSRSIVAQGIAINWYSNDQMSGRWGATPPSSPLRDKVARRIREHLAAPPHWIDHPADGRVAMNHASALAALRWVVVPRDAALIAKVAEHASDAWTKASLVMGAKACMNACQSSKQEPSEGDVQVLQRVLHGLAADEQLDPETREEAILQLSASAAEVRELLARLLEQPAVDLAAAAALSLMRTHFNEYRSRVAELLEEWKYQSSSTVAMARRVYDRMAEEQAAGH